MSSVSHRAAPDGAQLSARAVTVTWAVLVLLTVAGWAFARGHLDPMADRAAIVALVALAGLKIYLVLAVFMGLWRAPRDWHAYGIAWVIATFAIVGALVLWCAA